VSTSIPNPHEFAAELAQGAITRHSETIASLAQAFKAQGFTLALVGGPVRDAILGRLGNDLDFTTSARPEDSKKILQGWGDSTWDTGAAFGTIAAKRGSVMVEVTTYRSEKYDYESRKPDVVFGDSIEGDLSRRDFTVNAMALELTGEKPRFIDLFDGAGDLAKKILRTPAGARSSFSDDPLRMMRVARFVAQLGFSADTEVISAMHEMSQRLSIISAERIREEFSKTLMSPNPRSGLVLLVDTGLAAIFFPELPKLKLEIDEHHHHKDVYEHSLTVLDQAIAHEERLGGPNLTIRLAALMHDIGKPRTRELIPGGGVSFHHHEVVGAKMSKKRLKELRFDRKTIDEVSSLVFLHLRFHGYGGGGWTDSAVRRYIRDAGDLLTHLHVLTRADCTTRNKRKADQLAATYDSLELRIVELKAQEELDRIRPDLDGQQIMQILEIGPSRRVGEAYEYLLELRMERGPLGEELATKELLAWASDKELRGS
jgi:poly(A) polymerase